MHTVMWLHFTRHWVTGLALAMLAGGAARGRSSDGPIAGDNVAAEQQGDIIQLPNSDTRIAFWHDSMNTGTPGIGGGGYAISVAGGEFHTVENASYLLRLRYAEFDPLLGVPPVPPVLSAGAEIEHDDVERAWIVQFHTPPLDEYRRDLAAAGVTVRKFLANHAYIVHMDDAAREQVLTLRYVRWVGAYEPAYKVEPFLLRALGRDGGARLGARRYSIQVFERGLAHKAIVADRVRVLGGVVNAMTPSGFILEATLTGQQLIDVVQLPQVQWVDRYQRPQADMDLAREIGGANLLEAIEDFTGEGVRGEVMDTNLFSSHQDFQENPPINHGSRSGSSSHGTSVYGIVFGSGAGNSAARGMAPGAQGIFADFELLTDRYVHTAQLLQNPYFAVFQTNSWGGGLTTDYTSTSAEMDDILFINDILVTQSQSNQGSQDSRPQAWAKNIVSVGGVIHQNTLPKNDDIWGGASIGPAADGRVKPDLVHFFDAIFTTDNSGGYTNFCCTSGATPIVAGHFALFFQMWSAGLFGNEVDTDGTVFDNRPHMSTAKAMLINSADSYPFAGANHNLTRTHQGWGMPDLAQLHADRDRVFVVNEDRALTMLQTASYPLTVDAATPELRATLVYTDPAGTTSSNQHRINDLSLKVTSPTGTIYWGNNGLLTGNWSVAGGNANTIDTVENVFVQNPQPGVWTIEVLASEVNEDSHLETDEVDADFALVVAGVVPPAQGAPATLTGVEVTRGQLLAGGLLELAASDDTSLHTRSGFGQTLLDAHSMEMLISATTDIDAPSTLSITIESRVDEPGGTAVIRLRNWQTSGFDTIGQYAVGMTDEAVTIPDIQASAYVRGDGAIEAFIRHRVHVPFFAFTFESFVDEVAIFVE